MTESFIANYWLYSRWQAVQQKADFDAVRLSGNFTNMPKLETIVYHPEKTISETPLVFLHGAWHGAWCWEPYFLPWFRDKGYHCIALSLRNHGKSESEKGLNKVRISE